MVEDKTPTLGVVIVTFSSSNVVIECLESLLNSRGADLKIVVVDNDSPDDTCQAVIDWASGAKPYQRPAKSPLPDRPAVAKPVPLTVGDLSLIGQTLGQITLIRSGLNRGFAGGVNVGLRALQGQADWFWVLNPDCATPEDTPARYVERAKSLGDFALMTCNTVYYDWPDRIQTAGGYVNRRTGVCSQRGFNALIADTDTTAEDQLDWVTGANMVASAAFLEKAGLMTEDYFLYYEEVDWAFRRGDLEIVFLPEATVYHHGGTVIGTGSVDRRPSPFANYFNHRNRIRFARRFLSPWPVAAYLYGLAKAAQLLLMGAVSEAHAVVAGMFEWSPPKQVRDRFTDPEARRLALGPAET